MRGKSVGLAGENCGAHKDGSIALACTTEHAETPDRSTTMTNQVIRVGIVGCGAIAQLAHLPTLKFLNELFSVVAVCDISKASREHCAARFHVPHVFATVEELVACDEVDAVFIMNPDEFHTDATCLALDAGKYVMCEKPMTLNRASAQRILDAEARAGGSRVMVGYMRRCATAYLQFVDAVKQSGEPITFARMQDFQGPFGPFMQESGTEVRTFSDFPAGSREELLARAKEQVTAGLPVPYSEKANMIWRYTATTASHTLSATRELLGMPKGVRSAFGSNNAIVAMLDYEDYVCMVEVTRDNVHRYETLMEVHTPSRTFRLDLANSWIKGLPMELKIIENVKGAGYTERVIRSTYEDAYTLEFKEFHRAVTHGQPFKSSAADYLNDLTLFEWITSAAMK